MRTALRASLLRCNSVDIRGGLGDFNPGISQHDGGVLAAISKPNQRRGDNSAGVRIGVSSLQIKRQHAPRIEIMHASTLAETPDWLARPPQSNPGNDIE